MPQTVKKYQSECQEVTLLGMPQAVSEEAVIIIEVAFWEYWLQLTSELVYTVDGGVFTLSNLLCRTRPACLPFECPKNCTHLCDNTKHLPILTGS